MSKNKGLIIELTSLLDVILIMLFWVMMVSSDKADKAEQQAEQKVQAANAQAQVQVDEAKKDAERYINERLAEQKDNMEKLDEYVKTIEGFENGEMLSISITNVEQNEGLSFTRSGQQISSVTLTVRFAASSIRSVPNISPSSLRFLCFTSSEGTLSNVDTRFLTSMKHQIS